MRCHTPHPAISPHRTHGRPVPRPAAPHGARWGGAAPLPERAALAALGAGCGVGTRSRSRPHRGLPERERPAPPGSSGKGRGAARALRAAGGAAGGRQGAAGPGEARVTFGVGADEDADAPAARHQVGRQRREVAGESRPPQRRVPRAGQPAARPGRPHPATLQGDPRRRPLGPRSGQPPEHCGGSGARHRLGGSGHADPPAARGGRLASSAPARLGPPPGTGARGQREGETSAAPRAAPQRRGGRRKKVCGGAVPGAAQAGRRPHGGSLSPSAARPRGELLCGRAGESLGFPLCPRGFAMSKAGTSPARLTAPSLFRVCHSPRIGFL